MLIGSTQVLQGHCPLVYSACLSSFMLPKVSLPQFLMRSYNLYHSLATPLMNLNEPCSRLFKHPKTHTTCLSNSTPKSSVIDLFDEEKALILPAFSPCPPSLLGPQSPAASLPTPSSMTVPPLLGEAGAAASGAASVRQGQIRPVLIIAENRAPVLFTGRADANRK